MQIKKLGDFLKDRQLVEEEELIEAVHLAKQSGRKIGQVLLDIGALTEEDLLQAIGDQLGFNIVSLSNYPIDPKVVSLISREICDDKVCVPLKFDDNNSLHVAMKDVSNAELVQYLKFSTGKNIIPSIALESEIRNTIGRLYDFAASLEDLVSNVEKLSDLELVDPEREADAADVRSYTVTQIVKSVLAEAVSKGASDIHMEPSQMFMRVRIRIDGQLQNLINIPKWVQSQLVGCIKVQASLNIAEKRVPQDGKLSATIAGRHVDFRVSTLPTPQGEKVVIRIQDKGNKGYSLSSLNLPPYLLKQILRLLQNDKGIILVTGPTGSGKTTLLYSMLTELARRGPNIITVEDPIEYEFEGITQTQINEKAGMTFSTILRSILRQDPNVIMIGEIRDQETAEIAFRAAQTGHLVLSTLHTNSAVSVVTRLKDLGVEPFLIASTVLGIFAQRLVRSNCPACTDAEDVTHVSDPAQRKLLEMLPSDTTLRRGQGCDECSGSGYRGRSGVYEYLRFSPGVVDAVNGGLPEKQILQAARADGMKTLADECVRLIAEGTTSFAECSGILATLDMTEISADPHAEHHCPSCNKSVSAEFVVCPYCQYRLVCKCPKCEAHVERDWKVCPYCSEQIVVMQTEVDDSGSRAEAPLPHNKPLVLVVDEKDAMRRALNIILSQIGCEVVESSNGQDALDVAGNILPNLIIADFDTPHVDGSSLFRTLRESAGTSLIPFILLTQGGANASEFGDILEDVDGHLTKPFNYRELQARVRQLLSMDMPVPGPGTRPAGGVPDRREAPAATPVSTEVPAPVKDESPSAPDGPPKSIAPAQPLPAEAPSAAPDGNRVAEAAPVTATPPAVPVTVSPPAVPAGLSTQPGKSQVVLSFATPPGGVAAPSGYVLEISPARSAPITLNLAAGDSAQVTNGRVGARLSVDGATTTIEVTGLINGKSHGFALTARNASAASAAATATAIPAGVPEAPVITGIVPGDALARVDFSPPASHGGSFITGYTVYTEPPGGIDQDAGSDSLSHTVTGLVKGETYTFAVAAANRIGDGPLSAPSQAITFLTAPAPVVFAAVVRSAKVHLVFPTAVDKGCLPLRYTLTVSPQGLGPFTLNVAATPGATASHGTIAAGFAVSGARSALTVSGLSNGKPHVFRVSAANGAGESPPSKPVMAIPATVPEAPAIAGVSVANGEAVVSLTPPGSDGASPITGYTVISSPGGGVDQEAGLLGLAHRITGLDPATPYIFSAVAANALGNSVPSGPSQSVVPALPPGPPEVFAKPGKSHVMLSFCTPSDALPADYEVTVTPARANPVVLTVGSVSGAIMALDGMVASLERNGSEIEIRITGLINGKNHDFSVVASNCAGKSPPSPVVRAVPAGVPGAPSIIRVTAGDGMVTVEFAPPSSHGGSFITGYTVVSDPPWGIDENAGTMCMIHTVSGLHNGLPYVFQVFAHNGMGNGVLSAPSQRVLPVAPLAGNANSMEREMPEMGADINSSWLSAL